MNKLIYVYFMCLFIIIHSQEDIPERWKSRGANELYELNFYQPFSNYMYKHLSKKLIEEFEFGNIIDIDSRVKFYIYNKKNPKTRQQIILDDIESLRNSNWVPNIPTKIFVHGYVGNSSNPQMEALKNKLLAREEDINVIGMDWGPIAYMIYPIAAHYSDEVGKIGSKFIDFLCKNGAKPADFHIIGLSLGAHIAGFVGKHVKSGKVGRVTGLDPALYGFITEGKEGRLDKIDADFVDCIHTCGGQVGFMKPLCHADFYPNGGMHPQPGCADGIMGVGFSHVICQDFFTESIEKGHIFPAETCQKLGKHGPENCIDEGALMGYPASKKYEGIFYSKTGSKYPYAGIIMNSTRICYLE